MSDKINRLLSESSEHVKSQNMSDKINRLLSESSEHVRVKTCQTRSIGYCLSLVNMLESKHVRQDQ